MTIGTPSKAYDVAIVRTRRILLWTRVRVVRWRFVVAGLPLRDLLVMNWRINAAAEDLHRLSAAEACVEILGTFDALKLTDQLAREIWEWWHEANLLPMPGPARPKGTGGASPVLDLVFKLERWPFNFPTERVMQMTAAEAVARLEEFERAMLEREAERAAAA